jgi:hypothetical protein
MQPSEQLLSGALDLAALVREVRAGLLWSWFLFGAVSGAVVVLVIHLARRCDKCGR